MFYLKCNDPARAERIRAGFGVDLIPVLSPSPTMVAIEGAGDVLCYLVDLRSIPRETYESVAQNLVNIYGADMNEVKFQLTRIGLPILAANCVIVIS